MELRQIEYFMAVAAHQNFSRAAEHVHVSQPSLSVQIGGLERELGTRLFDRLGRKVVLTQAGELFHVHAERALRELDQAEQVVQDAELWVEHHGPDQRRGDGRCHHRQDEDGPRQAAKPEVAVEAHGDFRALPVETKGAELLQIVAPARA